MSKFLLKNKKGFTLIEMMVALTIFSASLIGSLTFLRKGISDITLLRNNLIANQLAQQGIEKALFIYSFKGNFGGLECLNQPCYWCYDETSGQYLNYYPDVVCSPLFIQQMEIINPTENNNYYTIKSKVDWDYKGIEKSSNISFKMYDWK